MHDLDHRNADELPFSETDAGTGLLGKTLRNAAVLVGACLAIAYAVGQVDDPPPATGTARLERPGPTAAVATARPRARSVAAADELVIPRDPGGHYLVDALVQGVTVRFLVDTGASAVTLSAEDAERIGFRSGMLDFDRAVQTANGQIRVAQVTLGNIQIGALELEEVSAMVTRAPMPVSLLGMSFLGRLAGYEARDGDLVLRW